VVVAVGAIRIRGLAEFNRSLRALSKDAPKQLRLVGNEAAAVVVKDAAGGMPKVSGKASGSVRAASTRTAARVRAGGAKAPYYPWLDYGGHVGQHGSTVRPFVKAGRFLYPAYARNRAPIEELLTDGLAEVARNSGLDVTSG
jgi:hypothetical protein